ncbi:MAG: ComEC/Rec2 family competence protein [Armatimonadota bacterium]|nr:ComEC/Rec2 family competence protein [Armatimonadota bacterium]
MRHLKGSRLLLILAVVVALIWAWAFWPRQPVLSVTFLDVRQGDCAFVRTPGGKTVLIDAGGAGESSNGYDVGSRVVVPFLRREGVRVLDLAVITHCHEDHVGGMPAVLKSIGARTVIDSGESGSSPMYERVFRLIEKRRLKYTVARRGQTISLPDGVRIDVLNPDDSGVDIEDDADINDHSVVLRLTYRRASFLFAADAETEAEENMVRTCGGLRSAVLKVGHHGSSNATSGIWLRAVRPRIAVISVGRRNPFGHPSAPTLQRLVDRGARIYRTDRDGAVVITTDGENLHVATTRR